VAETLFKSLKFLRAWRRGRDSNPRYGFPYTRFPSERLKPLGHLSKGTFLKALASLKSRRARSALERLKPLGHLSKGTFLKALASLKSRRARSALERLKPLGHLSGERRTIAMLFGLTT
jgi:hypothetical protein